MDVLKSSLILLPFILASCGPAPDMPEYKSASVELLDTKDEKTFYSLPLKGEVRNGEKYWSGDYWALNKGMINLRWNSPLQEDWDYISPTRDELNWMTPERIAQLSPVEKFDLYMGRYDYPLKDEVYSYARRNAADWEGICNGWAPASMNHNEPTPKTVTNPDGIPIQFGSSDIKALLSYYYAFIHRVENTHQLGRRCPRGSGWFNWNRDCQNDLNAGSFHIVLTNKVGKRNESFMVDIERFKEVWNHPVLSYVSRVEGEDKPEDESVPGTVKILKIRTKVTYVDESENNTWEPVRGTPYQSTVTREYSYFLNLNLNNEIIGGKWISSDRPDFLWTMGPAPKFLGLIEGLGTLLND